MITFQSEKWTPFYANAQELFPLHWQELAMHHDKYPFSIDVARYSKLDELGMLHISTVRNDGELVGYAINFLIVHMHYCTAGTWALTDMYFLLPEFRTGGTGAKMFLFMEKSLREIGIVQAHTSCKVHQDHQAMLEALGWQFTDKTFMKYLGDK